MLTLEARTQKGVSPTQSQFALLIKFFSNFYSLCKFTQHRMILDAADAESRHVVGR